MGIRYQCIICQNFNLCSGCEEGNEHEHALLKVKTANQAISRAALIDLCHKELPVPEKGPLLPPGHYIPSISKNDSTRVIEAAREAY